MKTKIKINEDLYEFLIFLLMLETILLLAPIVGMIIDYIREFFNYIELNEIFNKPNIEKLIC